MGKKNYVTAEAVNVILVVFSLKNSRNPWDWKRFYKTLFSRFNSTEAREKYPALYELTKRIPKEPLPETKIAIPVLKEMFGIVGLNLETVLEAFEQHIRAVREKTNERFTDIYSKIMLSNEQILSLFQRNDTDACFKRIIRHMKLLEELSEGNIVLQGVDEGKRILTAFRRNGYLSGRKKEDKNS